MKIEYRISETVHQCSLCRSWADNCRYFRIVETPDLHEAYRTLTTFKCAICDRCFSKGNQQVTGEIHKYMQEYIGPQA